MTHGRLVWLYGTTAGIGAVVPWALFLPWLREHGPDARLFAGQLFATEPAGIFAADVLLAAAVFLGFAWLEGGRIGMRHRWLPALVVVTVGLCCALPLFLAQREWVLARGERVGGAGGGR